MRQQYRMEVALTLLGPILTRGLTAEPGVDAPIARDGIGRPMLPFSLVKGKVRDAFGDLRPANDPSVTDWLGKASGKDLDPERGRLRFTDFTTEEKGDPEGLIERVEIDAKSGSVVPRHLAVLEAPFGYGQPVEFRGAVEFAADAEESPKIVDALDQAFRWVPAYGAMRTVGFGRTQKVATSVAPCPERSKGSPGGTTSFPLRLRFDRPLCLVGRKHSGNHFESLECVPGAVLKGAVARLVLDLIGSSARALDPRSPSPRWPTLSRCFEHVRFSEARPMSETATHGPVVPPLSLVTTPTRKGEYFDVALEPGPRLIAGAAPAFAPDWKEADESFIREAFGWPTLPRERRTRTSIEAGKGRALDQSLFSYGLVLPRSRRPGRSIESFVWETSVGVEHKDIAKTDRAAIVSELADLLAHGLPGVGKTRATAEVEWLKSPSAPKVAGGAPPGASEHVVTLQTEFLMTDPKRLQGGRRDDLEQAYREFWAEVSGGAFDLVRYFARQELHGGHLARRSRPGRYEPFLATSRGSTFVLRTTDETMAGVALNRWREGGLDVPDWVKARYGVEGAPLWKSCPFLPHAGFGEVAIDLVCHTKKPPGGSRP